jgi:WD40 repeat protein
LATGKKAREFLGHGSELPALAWSRGGKTLLTADSIIRQWDWQTGQPKQMPTVNPGPARGLAFLPDGSVVTGGDGMIVWGTDGRERRQLIGPVGEVDGAALSRDGLSVVVVSHTGPARELAVVGTGTGRKRRESKAGNGYSFGPVISPDGRSIAAATFDDSTLRVWDAATLTERRAVKLREPPAGGLSFSPDGRTLRGVMGGLAQDQIMFSLDTASGEVTELGKLGRGDQFHAFACSPDGKTLAAVGTRNAIRMSDKVTPRSTIRLFDAANGNRLRDIDGANGELSQIAFSPDGKSLATGGDDTVVTTWDVDSGKPVRIFRGHRGRILSLAFSPDGKRLASGGADTTVLIWDLSEIYQDGPNIITPPPP